MSLDFQKVYSLSVKDKVEKKAGLSYLSWSFAWAEFVKIYPNAKYDIKKNDKGLPYFADETGAMVYTTVTVDDMTHEMWLPVMDGANKAMKTTSYSYKTKYGEKEVEALTMFDVNKALMRCLVKNLAMFGLGLYVYAGEDLPEDNTPQSPNPTQKEKSFEEKVIAIKQAINAETTPEKITGWVARLLESHPDKVKEIQDIFGSLIKKGDK